jgi:hypothetical protein
MLLTRVKQWRFNCYTLGLNHFIKNKMTLLYLYELGYTPRIVLARKRLY